MIRRNPRVPNNLSVLDCDSGVDCLRLLNVGSKSDFLRTNDPLADMLSRIHAKWICLTRKGDAVR